MKHDTIGIGLPACLPANSESAAMSGARATARVALLPATVIALIMMVTIGAGPAFANPDCLSLWSPGTWAPGSITGCAADLMASRPGTRPGGAGDTAATGPVLTAAFHGLPAAHNGQKLFTFELRFSQEFQGLRLTALKQELEVTGGRLVDVKRTVRGQNQRVTVRVRPASDGAVTVRLPGKKKLWNPVSATVAGPAAVPTEPATPVASPPATPVTPPPAAETAAPLTATFHGLPDEHNGKKLFSFEIRFSEEFRGLRLTALKQALQVSGGRVIDVRRTVRGQNRRVTVRVRPKSHDPVTVALGATTDCAAAGAICASDGRQLSGSLSASVTSPAWWGGDPVVTHYSLAELKSLNLHPVLPKNVVKTVSTTKPDGFPTDDTGTVVNKHNVGQLRERWDRGGFYSIEYPCKTGSPPTHNTCNIGNVGGGVGALPGIDAYGRWFSYPSDAGANDMKVHVLVRRATYGSNGKIALSSYFRGSSHSSGSGSANLEYFYEHLDFFKAEAHLEAPGTGVKPMGAAGTTATWTGGVVGLDVARDAAGGGPNFWRRGDVIGGTATVTANFHNLNDPRVAVSLTNLKGSNVGTSYANLSWTGMTVDANGDFSGTSGGRTVEGTFRQQGTAGTSPNTVGGTFEMPIHHTQAMVGGFVATRQ